MPRDNEENDGVEDAEIIAQLRAQIQRLEADAARGGTAAATTAPPEDGFRRARYGLSNVQKLDAYTKQAHAISLMLSGVAKTHPADSTTPDDRRLVDEFERKGLGMEHSRHFIEHFRSACENTNSAKRFQTAMVRAEVKNKYDAAMVIETAATMDLKVDDSEESDVRQSHGVTSPSSGLCSERRFLVQKFILGRLCTKVALGIPPLSRTCLTNPL